MSRAISAVMDLGLVLRRTVLALALLGLALAPALPAVAGADAGIIKQSMAEDMQAMADGMPGCQDKQPVEPCLAKECPLAVLCVSATVAAADAAFVFPPLIGSIFGRAFEVSHASLLREPPPRPPRN